MIDKNNPRPGQTIVTCDLDGCTDETTIPYTDDDGIAALLEMREWFTTLDTLGMEWHACCQDHLTTLLENLKGNENE